MKNLWHSFVNFFFPFRCIKCKTFVYNDSIFCHQCWQLVEFLSEPCCYICSNPLEFSFNIPKNLQICAACHQEKPLFNKLISIFKYTDNMKSIVLNFKYHDKTMLARPFGKLIVNKLRDYYTQDLHIVTAVPLHRKKLRQRMYNQAALLAKQIATHLNIIFIPDLLIRERFNESQTNYTKKMRIKNIQGAFNINKKYKNIVNNKNILLIDDVITTGATINECCKILKKNHCLSITAATIAKRIL